MSERGGAGRLFGLGGGVGGGGGGGRSSWANMRIGGFSLERGGGSGDPTAPKSTSSRVILPVRHAKTTSGLPDILEHPAPSRLHRGLLPQCLVQRYRRPSREHQRPGSGLGSGLGPGREQRASSLCSSYTTSSSRLSRSPSPLSSAYYSSVSTNGHRTASSTISSNSRRSVLSPTPEPIPRRVFPQEPCVADLDGIEGKDESPVVFDVNLSFDLGSPPSSICGSRAGSLARSEVGGLTRTRIHQRLVPMAAHLEQQTASAFLTNRIASFLQRTDHVMEEWKRIGRKDPDEELNHLKGAGGVGRSRSAASILTRAIKYYGKQDGSRSSSRAGSRASSQVRSPSVSRDDATLSELDELSEMTVDLAEEHSTASLATDRLEVEVADRMRLEKELQDVQGHNKRLQQTADRLELELLHARTADLNGVHSDDEGGDGDGPSAALRQRYERTLRELEFTKRRLQQQHEDDLEQLVGLKKQLEKKLADAYEEVEEQRQVVGQWKRKVQKLNAETSDLRLLLENQSSRNNLLEKKQRKFDSELQLLQDELRGERQQRERLSREKEIALGEKYSMEQNLSALRLELELKEEKVVSLSRELDELTFGGKTEEEVAQLKKAKHQLEHKCKDQQEELDDLAGQVQLLEQAKLRLEMSLEQLRKEHRKEISQRDDELEEVRSNAHKKVKALEARLEDEHEERTQLVREKHELERRLGSAEEEWRARRSRDDGQVQRLRRDLRRTRALLADAQAQLERAKADTPGKAALRGLRNQLEDLEMARAQAVKARQMAEQELGEVQQQLEDAQRLRHESEERANAANRERADLRTQLEENEDELAEVMNKYRAAVHQLSAEQTALQDSVARVAELEQENQSLLDQLAELTARLASAETLGDPSSSLTAKRLELRCKELESRLELEQTTRARLDTQISRLKETVDKLQSETSLLRAREQSAQDQARKLQRSLREVREETSGLATRESEALERRKTLEKRLEAAEAEASSARTDLKVALQRIDDLQQAIQGDLELDDSSASDNSDNDNDSEGSDESIETFLANHNMGSGRLSTANSSKRSSLCERSPRQERTSMFDLSPREPCSTPKEETS